MDDLKIEYMSLSDIKPYRRNAKKHPAEQVEQIANSIIMAKEYRPKDRRLRSVLIDSYRRTHNSTEGLPRLKVNVIIEGGGSFKTTFNALGASTRGNLLVNLERSGMSSDGKTYSAVISNRQVDDASKELIKKYKKRK